MFSGGSKGNIGEKRVKHRLAMKENNTNKPTDKNTVFRNFLKTLFKSRFSPSRGCFNIDRLQHQFS